MDELGRRLRAAREAKGLTLEVAEDETKIRRKYLEALEAGREAVLPGDAYTKGFLRTYGNYLGLDGTALVDEYKQRKEPPADEPTPPAGRPASPYMRQAAPSSNEARRDERREALRRERAARRAEENAETEQRLTRTEAAPTAEPALRYTPRPRRPIRKEPKRLRNLGIAAVVLAMVGAVVYLGWLIFNQAAPPPQEPGTQQEEPPAPPPQTAKEPDTTPPAKQPDPPKVTMSQPNASDVIFLVPAKEISVDVEARGGDVWFDSTVDGKKESGRVLNNSTKSFKGADVLIRVGHMEGVSLIINGQRFEKPISGGGPYNLRFKGE